MSVRQQTRLALLRLAGRILADRGDRANRAHRDAARFWPRHDGHAGPPAEPLRILLIRPDHLGDVLLAGPARRRLATSLPAARIDWLVGPWAAEVVRRSGHAGAVLTCEFPGFTRRPKGVPWSPYATLLAEARRLRARRYDAAIVLRPDHWWGALLAAAASIPRRIGYAVPESVPFLTDTLPPPGAVHAVEANLALAQHAAGALGARLHDQAPGVLSRALAPSFAVSDEERAWAAGIVRELVLNGGPLVALHPGSGADVKNWLPDRWAAVAHDLKNRTGASVILTGGPAEAPLVERIAAGVTPSPPSLVGQTTLGQLAALFERCALVLGGDSGPLHLAAAVGTPTVRVYGPTSRAIFGAWGDPDRHVSLQASLPCQPCGNIAAPPCGATETPACLRVVGTATVVAKALRVLRGADGAGRPAVRDSSGTPLAALHADDGSQPLSPC